MPRTALCSKGEPATQRASPSANSTHLVLQRKLAAGREGVVVAINLVRQVPGLRGGMIGFELFFFNTPVGNGLYWCFYSLPLGLNMALDQTCKALAEAQLAQSAAAHLVVLGQPDL